MFSQWECWGAEVKQHLANQRSLGPFRLASAQVSFEALNALWHIDPGKIASFCDKSYALPRQKISGYVRL